MDHPEVRAWLEEASLLPGGLDEPADPRVEAHLDACSTCAAERDAMRATAIALNLAIGPPRAARERILSNVQMLGRQRGPAVGTRGAVPVASGTRRMPWLARPRFGTALALLALGALVFAAGIVTAGLLDRDAVEPSRVARVVAEMAEVVAEPDARSLTLRDRAGAPAGLVVHSAARDRLVVMTSALESTASGRYSCYLERDGERSEIGPMHFEGDTSFWAGPMGGPADAGRRGDRFVVVLDPSDGVPVLAGDF
jgi:hypothetical protein